MIIIPLLLSLAIIGLSFGKHLADRQIEKTTFLDEDNASHRSLNPDMESIKDLAKTVELHNKLSYTESYSYSLELLKSIVEIIERLSIDGSHDSEISAELDLALSKYGNMARKVNTLLSENVFLDIKNNPKRWKNADETISQIIQAVKDSTESVNEDIIKFNESKTSDIRIALKSINDNTEQRNNSVENIFKDIESSDLQNELIYGNIQSSRSSKIAKNI